MKKTLPGFTLVELAVVIAIIGALSYFGLGMVKTMRDTSARKITSERRAVIVKVLAGYVKREGHLPEPYNPKLEEGVAGEFVTGMVPYKKLQGLDESLTKDGYGNYFTYAVAPKLAGALLNSKYDLSEFCKLAKSPIQIKGVDGSPKAEHKDVIAVVLISHGPEGRGAYLASGEQRPAVAEFEKINADETPNFIKGSRTPNFQHTLWWASRDNFVSVYVGGHCAEVNSGIENGEIEDLDKQDEKAKEAELINPAAGDGDEGL